MPNVSPFIYVLYGLALLSGIWGMLELGGRISRRFPPNPEIERVTTTIENSVFALLGLMLAFTFASAMQRFDERRRLIAEETNAISTAWLRLDLLAPNDAAPIRQLFRDYVDVRLDQFAHWAEPEKYLTLRSQMQSCQESIWQAAARAVNAREAGTAAPMLLLPALNAMLDITTSREMAMRMHPPRIIFGMVVGLAFLATILCGYGLRQSSRRPWLHMLVFTVALSLAIVVIWEIEFPRKGLLQITRYDAYMVDLRASMEP